MVPQSSLAMWLAVWLILYFGARRLFSLSKVQANRLVSTIHASMVGWGGIVLLLDLSDEAPSAQFLEFTPGVTFYGTLFITYLACDLLYELFENDKLDRLALFHHVLFLTIAVLCAAYSFLGFCFAWLAIGELSTPFINIHFVMTQELRAGRAAPWMSFAQKVNVCIGWLLFFLCRIVGYGFGMRHLFSSRSLAVIMPPPHPVLYLPICCIVLGYLLNGAWMFAVTKTVRKVVSGNFKQKST